MFLRNMLKECHTEGMSQEYSNQQLIHEIICVSAIHDLRKLDDLWQSLHEDRLLRATRFGETLANMIELRVNILNRR